MQLILKTKGWLAMGRCNKAQARCLRRAALTALLWHTKGDLGPSRFKVLTPFLESKGDLLDGCGSRHRAGDYLPAAPLKPLQVKEVCRRLTRGVDREPLRVWATGETWAGRREAVPRCNINLCTSEPRGQLRVMELFHRRATTSVCLTLQATIFPPSDQTHATDHTFQNSQILTQVVCAVQKSL